jgi:hypothetical protein
MRTRASVPRLLPTAKGAVCCQAGPSTADPEVSGPLLFQIQTGKGEYGPFCGKTLPHRIETKSNTVTITFVTDESGDHTGWKIHYTSTGKQWVSHSVRKLGTSAKEMHRMGPFPARPRKGNQV